MESEVGVRARAVAVVGAAATLISHLTFAEARIILRMLPAFASKFCNKIL